jgi:hypothetical protein
MFTLTLQIVEIDLQLGLCVPPAFQRLLLREIDELMSIIVMFAGKSLRGMGMN